MRSLTNKLLIPVLYVIGVIILLAIAFSIIQSFQATKNTGLLQITSPDNNATLSVSADHSQAQFIGVGGATIRLKPGTYLVAAADNGAVGTQEIQISQGKQATISINPSHANLLPSVENITFTGLNTLVNAGLTSDQATNLELLLFQFKPTARAISIDNVNPAPRDPNTSTSFTDNFSLTVDGTQYNASLTYTNLTDIQLSLYSSTDSSPVFSSNR